MKIITIGLDLAKSVFQVHGVDANGRAMVRKKLRRAEVLRFFEALPAWLAWKPVQPLTTGPGGFRRWATRCD